MSIRLAPWTSLPSCLGRRRSHCAGLQGCLCRSRLMMDSGWRVHVRGQVPFIAVLRILPWLHILAARGDASVGLHVFGAGRVARLNFVLAGDDLLVAHLNSVLVSGPPAEAPTTHPVWVDFGLLWVSGISP
ncbi:hypothetical protein ILYODFUR_010318 [Ilyodon furcidens]|uniref:Uncharacterized protein n=1 Tax=Ilyodon furcidens TaxID=33524 RepID=A0ABV0UU99_9TELE